MRGDEYLRYDAVGLAELVRRREVTALELLEAAEALAEARDGTFNAIIRPLWQRARAALEHSSGGSAGATSDAPPFQGVPFLLKDLNQMLAGEITSNGSRLFADNVADHDSTLVQRYRAAGLSICGKTNTPELGLATTTEPLLHGPTRNPWNPAFSTGGSSGGAAAAVAAGIVPMAHATDGGGSIRIPAACCGLFGLKPTRGRVPLGPAALEGWGGLSCAHAITRSVRDSAVLLDATAGDEPGSPYSAPGGSERCAEAVQCDPGRLRIGFCTTPFNGAPVDREIRTLLEDTARALAQLGHDVEEAQPAIDAGAHRQAHGVLALCHTGAAVSAYAERRGRAVTEQDVEAVTWRNLQDAAAISGPDCARAVAAIHQLGRSVAEFFQRWDLLLTPVMACTTPRLGALDMMTSDMDGYLNLLYRMIGFTALFNDTGNPAMSVPVARDAGGLPVGAQLVAATGGEALLFRVAGQLERAQMFQPGLPASPPRIMA